MRIRAQHYLLLIVALMTAFVVFAVYWSGRSGVDSTEDAETFFVHLDQSSNVGEGPVAGLLPPADADPSHVPMIELETTEFDMGVIPNDKIAQAKLKVYNRGKAPLVISDINTTCLCTQGFVPKAKARPEGKELRRLDMMVVDTIPPGGESYIDLFVNPNRIPGFESKKTLTISSNDPANSQLTCQVNALVDPEFSMEPKELNYGEVMKGQSPSLTVRIRQIQEAPFEIKGVIRIDPKSPEEFHGTVTMLPEEQWKTPGKREWDVAITLVPTLPAGDFLRYAFFETTLTRAAGYDIPLMAHVSAPYTMEPTPPKELVIRPGIAGSDGKTATASITSESLVTVSDIQAKTGSLRLEARAGDTPNKVLLVASIPEGAPMGRIDDEFSFNVTNAKGTFPEKLTVRAYVRAPNDTTSGTDTTDGTAPPAVDAAATPDPGASGTPPTTAPQ